MNQEKSQTIQLIETAAVPAAVTESGSAALMRLIERAALDEKFDVAKLEKLLEVKTKREGIRGREGGSDTCGDSSPKKCEHTSSSNVPSAAQRPRAPAIAA